MPLPNSPILQSPLMAQSDTNKYVLFNDAMVKIEDSINRGLAVDMSVGAVLLTESQILAYGIFNVTTGASGYNLTIPATVGTSPPYATNRVLVIRNVAGASAITVKHPTGSTVLVDPGNTAIVYADGTNIEHIGGAISEKLAIVVDATAAKTVNTSDSGSMISFTHNAGAVVVTVPLTATGTFSNGDTIILKRSGSSSVTITPAASVTIESADSSNILRVQNSTATLVYLGADVWSLFGDLV